MAIYTEIGSGGTIAAGCVIIDKIYYNFATYRPRDIVYDKLKASRGILYKVAIKRTKIFEDTTLYLDTFNEYWNEDDLVIEVEAIALARDYYERQIADVNSLNLC